MLRLFGFLATVAFVGLPAPAFAHPHVWIVARAELVYAPDGKVAAVRHAWTFDKGYSAFITQGLDANGDGKLSSEEMKDLAAENAKALSEFDYFTVLKANGGKQAFDPPREPVMTYADEAVTLRFLLPLKSPAVANKALSFEVFDPTFFVSFALAPGAEAVTLSGAPKGCATTISRPKTQDQAPQQNLSEAFFQGLAGGSDFGAQFASRAIVACP